MDSEFEICMWELTALHYLTAMLSSMSQDNDKLGHFLKHNVKLFVPVLHLISLFFFFFKHCLFGTWELEAISRRKDSFF